MLDSVTGAGCWRNWEQAACSSQETALKIKVYSSEKEHHCSGGAGKSTLRIDTTRKQARKREQGPLPCQPNGSANIKVKGNKK